MKNRLIRIESHLEDGDLWVLTNVPGYVIKDAIRYANEKWSEEGYDWDICFENLIRDFGGEVEFVDEPKVYTMD